MKKLFLLLLCLIMTTALLLSACSPDNPDTGDNSGDEGGETGGNEGGESGGNGNGGNQGGETGGNENGGNQGGESDGNGGDQNATLPLSYYVAYATEMNQTSGVLHITDLSLSVEGTDITLNFADFGAFLDENNRPVAYGGFSIGGEFDGDAATAEELSAYAIMIEGTLYAEAIQKTDDVEAPMYLVLPLNILTLDGAGFDEILDQMALMLADTQSSNEAAISELAVTCKSVIEMLFTTAEANDGYVHTFSFDIFKQLNEYLYTNTLAGIVNATMGPDTYESLDDLAIQVLSLTFADIEELLVELGTDIETLAPEIASAISELAGETITAEDLLLMFEEYAELPFLSMFIKEENLEQMKSSLPELLATYGDMTLYEIIAESGETTPEGIKAEVNGVIDELAQMITVTIETNKSGSEVVNTVALNIPGQVSVTLTSRLESDETSEEECLAMAENIKLLSEDLELPEGVTAYMFDSLGNVMEIEPVELLDIIFGDAESETGNPEIGTDSSGDSNGSDNGSLLPPDENGVSEAA